MNGSKAVRNGMGLLAIALAASACGLLGGFHLSASNLQIGPNPAAPGDEVVATFNMSIAPLERYSVILLINGAEHVRVTSSSTPSTPYILVLGDAADLITKYGTGAHSARIEVLAEEQNERARTQSYNFELRTSAQGMK